MKGGAGRRRSRPRDVGLNADLSLAILGCTVSLVHLCVGILWNRWVLAMIALRSLDDRNTLASTSDGIHSIIARERRSLWILSVKVSEESRSLTFDVAVNLPTVLFASANAQVLEFAHVHGDVTERCE